MTPEERNFLHQSSVRIPTVNRLLALYVCMLAGFWGGHKFLLGARREGLIYLCLSWTAVPLLAALADLLDLARQPAVGQGFAQRRLLARHPADRDMVEGTTLWRLARCLAALLIFAGLAACLRYYLF